MRVLFTSRAEQQIDSLYSYIALRSGEQRAESYIRRIISFCQALRTFPHRGRRRDDLLPGLRLVGFERRVTVAFTVTDDAVLIEGVFYGGQNISATWRPG